MEGARSADVLINVRLAPEHAVVLKTLALSRITQAV
jgi:hypothetical protein